MIRRLEATEVANRWREIRPHLLRALARGVATHRPGDVLAECLAESLVCWVALDEEQRVLAAIFAEIVDHPAARHCVIAWAGGRELGRWRAAMLAAIETWAREVGAERLECLGRPGWRRVAGFRVQGLHLTKEI